MSVTSHSSTEPRSHETGIAIRRDINDEIARTVVRFDRGQGGKFEFLCECGDLRCGDRVWLSVTEFRRTPAGSVLGH